jgi:hypothetical protein
VREDLWAKRVLNGSAGGARAQVFWRSARGTTARSSVAPPFRVVPLIWSARRWGANPFDTGCLPLSYSGNPGVKHPRYVYGGSYRGTPSWCRVPHVSIPLSLERKSVLMLRDAMAALYDSSRQESPLSGVAAPTNLKLV